MTKIHGLLTTLLLLGASACSSDSQVDIGDGKLGESLTDYAATWDGYAEAYTFSDGSDRVRLNLDANGEGTFEVGESPAVVTDPANPPGASRPELVPGFAYTVRFSTVEDNRLRFRIDANEVVAPWCSAQTSYEQGAGSGNYLCVPSGGSIMGGEACFIIQGSDIEIPVDCDALMLCRLGDMCKCSASGCSTPEIIEESPVQFAVDGALDASGDELEGTLLLGELEASTPTIRLTRQ
jgi:hypothetical protein